MLPHPDMFYQISRMVNGIDKYVDRKRNHTHTIDSVPYRRLLWNAFCHFSSPDEISCMQKEAWKIDLVQIMYIIVEQGIFLQFHTGILFHI